MLHPLTVAVASYQRRGPLLRLLRAIDDQVASDHDLGRDLDVHVVIDGSTDGSAAAVRSGRWSMAVHVHEQRNRGLASARNVGLAAAGAGSIVWFLDDDLVPAPGLVARHRFAHASGPPRVVVGTCRIPDDVEARPSLRAWWDDLHAEIIAAGTIARFDHFTAANTSAPAELISSVGGFDERFVGYGLEDHELAVRLLRAGTRIDHDPDAVAWHPDVPTEDEAVERRRSTGENAARLVELHPELIDDVFPDRPDSAKRRALRLTRLRGPRGLMAVSRLASAVHRLATGRSGTVARRAQNMARAAARASGVAAGDPTGQLLARELGRRVTPRRPASRRASRQPANSPTSRDTTISR